LPSPMLVVVEFSIWGKRVMSNLESARVALEAELSQARQGYVYYQTRIESLQQALLQLGQLGGDAASTGKVVAKGKRGRKPGKAVANGSLRTAAKATTKTASKKAAKAVGGRKAATDKDLPFTGGDYWPNLVTSDPQSGADILHAAIAQLGYTPTKKQVQKLTNRLTFALHALVKSGKIRDSGSGRERRFFK
ncbi:MAG TPA: hypothetical protein VK832_03510, partial [Burkholderiaceae bacterium]|nr:hypothetical protein [Burkholderiaceae bacterium]